MAPRQEMEGTNAAVGATMARKSATASFIVAAGGGARAVETRGFPTKKLRSDIPANRRTGPRDFLVCWRGGKARELSFQDLRALQGPSVSPGSCLTQQRKSVVCRGAKNWGEWAL